MKTTLILCMLLLATACAPKRREWTLPTTPAAQANTPRTYRFTCDYHYLDARGNPDRREYLSALYTRDLPGDRVRWSEVTAGKTPRKRDFMEGFGYPRAALKDMLTPEFFRGFPPEAMFERNLVFDTHMLEDFGQNHFAALKLNLPFHLPPAAVPLAGMGDFKLNDLQLTWTGVSRRHGRECAVIDYRAFLNTLEMKLPGVDLVAGSNFWGQVWVSLKSQRIEYGTLYEAMVGEMRVQGKPRAIHVFRTGVFEPVNQ